MKLRLLAASLAALGLTAGSASAQTAPAPQAQPSAPAPVAANKPVLTLSLANDSKVELLDVKATGGECTLSKS